MKTLLLLLIFLSLNAQNPKLFSKLADKIYDQLPKIKELKKVDALKNYDYRVDQYTQEVELLKKQGFKLEKKEPCKISVKEYLKALRELSKENDFFIRLAKKTFDTSFKENNVTTFKQLLDTGMVSITQDDEEIVRFYADNKDDYNLSILDEYVQRYNKKVEEETQKQLEEHNRYRSYYEFQGDEKLDRIKRAEKMREAQRLKAIEEQNRKEKEALEKKLIQELKH